MSFAEVLTLSHFDKKDFEVYKWQVQNESNNAQHVKIVCPTNAFSVNSSAVIMPGSSFSFEIHFDKSKELLNRNGTFKFMVERTQSSKITPIRSYHLLKFCSEENSSSISVAQGETALSSEESEESGDQTMRNSERTIQSSDKSQESRRLTRSRYDPYQSNRGASNQAPLKKKAPFVMPQRNCATKEEAERHAFLAEHLPPLVEKRRSLREELHLWTQKRDSAQQRYEDQERNKADALHFNTETMREYQKKREEEEHETAERNQKRLEELQQEIDKANKRKYKAMKRKDFYEKAEFEKQKELEDVELKLQEAPLKFSESMKKKEESKIRLLKSRQLGTDLHDQLNEIEESLEAITQEADQQQTIIEAWNRPIEKNSQCQECKGSTELKKCLSCGNGFHVECINHWLDRQGIEVSCPNCRSKKPRCSYPRAF